MTQRTKSKASALLRERRRQYHDMSQANPLKTEPLALSLLCGQKLFSFNSFEEWQSREQCIWRSHGVDKEMTLCVDQRQRPLTAPDHFRTARDDNAYPVHVYLLREDVNPTALRAATRHAGRCGTPTAAAQPPISRH